MENNQVLEKNKIEARLASIENGIVWENYTIFFEEVLNLIDEVGDGFMEEDYWALARYYSKINGVKNVRFRHQRRAVDEVIDNVPEVRYLEVKLLSPLGDNLPEWVNIRGKKYEVCKVASKNYQP